MSSSYSSSSSAIHKVNNKQQDKHIEAQVWGEASDKTPVYAADVIVTYQVLPEKSAWLYSNVSDIKNLVGDELVASAIKSAMAELGPNEVTNRTKIEPLAQQKLAESLVQKYGDDVVFVNKVVINDMNFEDAYNEAIQQKSIAQQNVTGWDICCHYSISTSSKPTRSASVMPRRRSISSSEIK